MGRVERAGGRVVPTIARTLGHRDGVTLPPRAAQGGLEDHVGPPAGPSAMPHGALDGAAVAPSRRLPAASSHPSVWSSFPLPQP